MRGGDKTAVALAGAILFVVIVLVAVLLIYHDSSEGMAVCTELAEEQCISEEFQLIANDLRDLATLKEACAWIEDPMTHRACLGSPSLQVLPFEGDCERLRIMRGWITTWINDRKNMSEFVAACRKDAGCFQWYLGYTSEYGEPVWWQVGEKAASESQ